MIKRAVSLGKEEIDVEKHSWKEQRLVRGLSKSGEIRYDTAQRVYEDYVIKCHHHQHQAYDTSDQV